MTRLSGLFKELWKETGLENKMKQRNELIIISGISKTGIFN
jgi:hypothetical protein